MSEEQLKAFLEKVRADASLQEKLKAAADNDAVAAIAKEAGFMISADDLKNAQSELSDEELEGVAAGREFRMGISYYERPKYAIKGESSEEFVSRTWEFCAS